MGHHLQSRRKRVNQYFVSSGAWYLTLSNARGGESIDNHDANYLIMTKHGFANCAPLLAIIWTLSSNGPRGRDTYKLVLINYAVQFGIDWHAVHWIRSSVRKATAMRAQSIIKNWRGDCLPITAIYSTNTARLTSDSSMPGESVTSKPFGSCLCSAEFSAFCHNFCQSVSEIALCGGSVSNESI